MQNKKICYLHIGPHKTGSTSLQQSLFHSREWLAENGYYYPDKQSNHTFISISITKDRFRWPIRSLRFIETNKDGDIYYNECRNHLLNILENNKSEFTIFSSESFSKFNEQECQKLGGILEEYFDETKVICYVRHPLSLLKSIIQQKVGNGRRNFDLFPGSRQSPFIYKSNFDDTFIKVFGLENIIFRD